MGFVLRSSRGRMITDAALAHLNLSMPPRRTEAQGRLF
jgi:Holliday junction resolvasome RuvABC ATP-dependent DNA helicase subunit